MPEFVICTRCRRQSKQTFWWNKCVYCGCRTTTEKEFVSLEIAKNLRDEIDILNDKLLRVNVTLDNKIDQLLSTQKRLAKLEKDKDSLVRSYTSLVTQFDSILALLVEHDDCEECEGIGWIDTEPCRACRQTGLDAVAKTNLDIRANEQTRRR